MADNSHNDKTEKVQIPELDVKEPAQESAVPVKEIEKGTIKDLDPPQEVVKMLSEIAHLRKTELEVKKWLLIIRSSIGIILMSVITFFILFGLGYIVYALLPVILDPSADKGDKQLAISVISIILGGAITFLLTNVISYFDKKD